jgi:hypothetical protein
MCQQVIEYRCGEKVQKPVRRPGHQCLCPQVVERVSIAWRDCQLQRCRGCNPTGSSWSYHQRYAYAHESSEAGFGYRDERDPLFARALLPDTESPIPNDIIIPIRENPEGLRVSGQQLVDMMEANVAALEARLETRRRNNGGISVDRISQNEPADASHAQRESLDQQDRMEHVNRD